MADVLLRVDDLATGYDGTQILWGVSIHVGAGEIVALLGPNGSGKSTLMNAISGLVPPWSGRIIFEGTPIEKLGAHQRIDVGIAHVLERHRLFPYMSVLENLQLGCGPRGSRAAIAAGLDMAYALFPRLRERTNQMSRTLSGGEQQMVAIARGLMSRPRLLLIDEPFIGLAPHLRTEVAQALIRINNEGVAILVIEQNVEAALTWSKRAYILREGRVVLTDAADHLRGTDAVRAAFLGRTTA